ncbi:MAG: hypothetical protein RLZZ77_1063 [Bacteroidota bacterium]
MNCTNAPKLIGIATARIALVEVLRLVVLFIIKKLRSLFDLSAFEKVD